MTIQHRKIPVLPETTEDPLQDNLQASLVTTINSKRGCTSVKVRFVRADKRTLACNIIPKFPGPYSFRAEFSLDRGTTWLHDTVPDAWVLIDPPQVNGLRLYTLIPAVSGTILVCQIQEWLKCQVVMHLTLYQGKNFLVNGMISKKIIKHI